MREEAFAERISQRSFKRVEANLRVTVVICGKGTTEGEGVEKENSGTAVGFFSI